MWPLLPDLRGDQILITFISLVDTHMSGESSFSRQISHLLSHLLSRTPIFVGSNVASTLMSGASWTNTVGDNGGDLPFGTINPPVNHHTKIFPRICPGFRSTQVDMGQTWAYQNGILRCMHIYLYTTKNLINICNIRESRFFAIDSFDPYTNVFDPSPTGTHLAEIMRIHLPCRSCADTWPWGESSVLFFAVATWRKALLEHAPFLRLACFLMAVRWLASANSWEMQIQPWQCNFYRASIK